MYTCAHCGNTEVQPDDVYRQLKSGKVLCLRCVLREGENSQHMTQHLLDDVAKTVNELESP